MKRIVESLACLPVMAPASVNASTDTTSGYVDASGTDEVVFVVSAAPLGAGKSLTVTLLAAGDDSGSDAQELGEAVFTDAAGTEAQTAVVSYRPDPQQGRYVAVKFQHDAAAAVVCSVVALAGQLYRPAENGWTLMV